LTLLDWQFKFTIRRNNKRKMPKIYKSDSMTKWGTKAKPKDLKEEVNKTHKPVVISDYNNDGRTNGFECKWCQRIIYNKFTDDSIWCNSCQSETIFDKDTKPVKKGIKAETMDNPEVFVTSVQYNFEDMAGRTNGANLKNLKAARWHCLKKVLSNLQVITTVRKVRRMQID
jgi:hypothetical protein